ncbi:MAG: HlyD family efflux transporter periplasmic adaptor subunit [Enhygromyxa sp.]
MQHSPVPGFGPESGQGPEQVDPRPQALLVMGGGDDDDGVTAIQKALASRVVTITRSPDDELASTLARGEIALIVLHGLTEAELTRTLAQVDGWAPVIVSDSSPSDRIRADPRVYFVISSQMAPDDLEGLLASAVNESWSAAREYVLDSSDDAELHKAVLEAAGRFAAAEDLTAAARAVSAALVELLRADRVHCLFHDSESGALWSPVPPGREERASTGLSGYVARTGKGLWIRRADQDPRYCEALDDPGGDGREQLLVAPLRGESGVVHAVIVIVRAGHRTEFNERERGSLGLFLQRAQPMVEHLARREELAALLREHEEGERGPFRIEALRERKRGPLPGDVVRVTGAWVAWTYRLVLLLVLAGLAYLVFGRVSLYSTGPAVVRLHQRVEVNARASGALAELLVEPGEVVEQGQLLARLDDSAARNDLERVETAWRGQLRARLLDPSDEATAASLVTLRRQLSDARAAVAERELRAPVAGTVSDFRIRPGQHISVGELVLSLLLDDQARRVVALMPGADSPRIERGMTMRIELPGYSRAYQHLTVSHVSEEIVGPAEVRRFLGPALADTLAIQGPVVLVEARLPEPTFAVDGQRYRYHEGMQATAEIRVRSKSLLELLIPSLEGALPDV